MKPHPLPGLLNVEKKIGCLQCDSKKKNVKEMNTDIYHKSLSVECFTIPD